jgi:hypothetical protein
VYFSGHDTVMFSILKAFIKEADIWSNDDINLLLPYASHIAIELH